MTAKTITEDVVEKAADGKFVIYKFSTHMARMDAFEKAAELIGSRDLEVELGALIQPNANRILFANGGRIEFIVRSEELMGLKPDVYYGPVAGSRMARTVGAEVNILEEDRG